MADAGCALFSYQLIGDGRVRICWRGREVTLLTGARAAWFVRRVRGAAPHEVQLLLARVTGNFKRGNERSGER